MLGDMRRYSADDVELVKLLGCFMPEGLYIDNRPHAVQHRRGRRKSNRPGSSWLYAMAAHRIPPTGCNSDSRYLQA